MITASGFALEANLQHMQIILLNLENTDKTTVTVNGVISEDIALPATVRFSLPNGFVFAEVVEFDTVTGDRLSDASYSADVSENSTVYLVTLSEGHGFTAGFDLDGSVFEQADEMAGVYLASFMFMPSEDLESLTIGFVAPNREYIGAGTDVIFLGEADDGEVYGIIREDVKKGEMQDFVIAFTLRSNRDAALAEQAAAEAAAAELAKQQTFGYWITSPTGLITIGLSSALIISFGAFILLIRKQRKPVSDASNPE